MKRNQLPQGASNRALRVLALAAALAIVGCDSKVNFSPTVPPVPSVAPLTPRNLEISGSLTSEGSSCLEATILYDGRELAGARTKCPSPGGCTSLQLTATTVTDAGHHLISFQVLRQSSDTARYRGEGTAVVSRESLPWNGVPINLGPTEAMLRAGEGVTFGVDFVD